MNRVVYNFIILVLIISSSCSSVEDEIINEIQEFTLTINSGDGGSVSASGGVYEESSTVNVTATPNSEYIFQNWSNGSTDNPLKVTVNQNITLTANFIKRKYPLTINIQGEGTVREEIVSTGKSTPTEYNSGTTVLLTAVPNDGWEFSSWSGDIESSNSTITTLINEPKNINLTFSEIISPSITSSLKSKMFTKGVKDTISISFNIPGGFHSVNVSSDLGNISVFSSPDQGSINGELVLEYTNQSVDNVLRDVTISGYDPVEIIITDNFQNETTIYYNIRTQPKPVYKNYSNSSSTNYRGLNSRLKLNFTKILYKNRRGNLTNLCFDTDELVMNNDTFEYFEENMELDESKYYFNTNWNPFVPDGYTSFEQGSHFNYLDINGDGYEDILLIRVGSYDNCYSCIARPLEFYLYDDGEYVYNEINIYGDDIDPKFFNEGLVSISDFDNDGDPDFVIGGQIDNKGGDENTNDPLLFENKYNEGMGFRTYNLYNMFLDGCIVCDSFDVNLDGLQDIYIPKAGNPIFLINKGGFSFEKLYSNPNNSDFNIWKYESPNLSSNNNFILDETLRFNFSHNIFQDINNDGVTDHFVGMPNGYFEQLLNENKINEDVYQELMELSSIRVDIGQIIYNNNERYISFNFENIVNIPDVIGFPYFISAFVKDINNDGLNELVITRAQYNSIGDPSGHYIQILQLNGTQIKDITSTSIENNFSYGDENSIEDFCVEHDIFWNHLRADDIDGDGVIELFSDTWEFPTYSMRLHLWKWNGSKFVKVSP